jgi:hypothetical protein
MHGGDTLKIAKKLGCAEMEALAPYLRDNARLRTLVLSGTELGKETGSVEVLAQALKTNTTVTMLDLSNNNLNAKGVKVVVKLLARCVLRVVVVFYAWLLGFNFHSPYCLCFHPRFAHHICDTGATMGNKRPQRQPHGITTETPNNASDIHQRFGNTGNTSFGITSLWHHYRYHRATITTDITSDIAYLRHHL